MAVWVSEVTSTAAAQHCSAPSQEHVQLRCVHVCVLTSLLNFTKCMIWSICWGCGLMLVEGTTADTWANVKLLKTKLISWIVLRIGKSKRWVCIDLVLGIPQPDQESCQCTMKPRPGWLRSTAFLSPRRAELALGTLSHGQWWGGTPWSSSRVTVAGLNGTAEINKMLLNPDQSGCHSNKTPWVCAAFTLLERSRGHGWEPLWVDAEGRFSSLWIPK